MAVKLVKTNKYQTYQLYAVMSNKNTKLTDGLKLAALICLKWIKSRLEGFDIPEELNIGDIDEYKKLDSSVFKSFTIRDSYIIEVESDIDLGIWSLRIIENDLGALDKDNMVPGRIIQSDIAFRIVNDRLECGFKTTISDSQDVEKAKCIRFAVVKELAQLDAFGLSQVDELYNPNNMIIEDLYEIKNIIKSKDNQLPCIIYTYDDHTIGDVEELKKLDITTPIDTKLMKAQIEAKEEENPLEKKDAYANRNLGKARTYFLPKNLFKEFSEFTGIQDVKIGEVYIVEPRLSAVKRYDYNNKEDYKNYIENYTRDKGINFYNVLFVDETRLLLDQHDEEKRRKNEEDFINALEKLEQIKIRNAREERIAEYKIIEKIDNTELDNAINELEKANNQIELLRKEVTRLGKETKDKEYKIEFYKRKDNRPNRHEDIVNWSSQFNGLIFNSKAVKCLESNDATRIDIDRICDAIDYLGTIYYDHQFDGLDEDELNRMSSLIYNRPFNVTPSGIDKSARGDCKIKYAFEGEKSKEYVLDQHLKIGNGSDLLRIYFIIDKQRKKIVIGSLPNHLVY